MNLKTKTNMASRSGRDLFADVNAAILPHIRSLCSRWLPNGRVEGVEYVALNPTRVDRNLGSFRINLRTSRWADFATNDRGGDLISFYAYIHGMRQIDAAKELANQFGVAV